MADEEAAPAPDPAAVEEQTEEAAEQTEEAAAPAEEAAPPQDEIPKEEESEEVSKPIVPDEAENLVNISSGQIEETIKRQSEIAETKQDTLSIKQLYEKKSVVGEVIGIRRDSFGDAPGVQKVARFLNTYKMEPDIPYNPEQVDKILGPVMQEAFEAYIGLKLDEEGAITDIPYYLPYHADLCIKQAKWASDTIRAKIKNLNFSRYKFIIIVTMGEKNNQDMFCCCRFLWDFEKDNYNTYTFENPIIFGYVLVLGLYYE